MKGLKRIGAGEFASEALDLEVVVVLGRSGRGRRLRRGSRARRSGGRADAAGVGAGWPLRRGSRSNRPLAVLRLRVVPLVEVVPGRVARRADAGDAQREIVGVRRLPQRFLVRDDV